MARTWNDNSLKKIVLESTSMLQVMKKLGLKPGGDSIIHIKKHIVRLNINTSHFRLSCPNPIPLKLNEVFIINSKTIGTTLRKIVLRNNIIPYECKICGNKGKHLDKPLCLQLDHDNGISNDNRKENLRFLCPNCHSQTPTHSIRKDQIKGANITYITTICSWCKNEFSLKKSRYTSSQKYHKNIFCSRKCAYQGIPHRKCPIDIIMNAYSKTGSFLGASKILGMSDSAIRKRIISHNQNLVGRAGNDPATSPL